MKPKRRIACMQTFLRQRQDALGFEQVNDPRDRRGRRWSLGALLSWGVLSQALLAPSLRRAEQLSEDLCGSALLRGLGIRRRVPDNTLGEAIASAAPADLVAALHAQVRAEHRRKALRPERLPVGVVAIDGKTPAVLREAPLPYFCQQQSSERRAPYYLYRVMNAALVSSKATVCVHQMPIPAHTNEAGYFRTFFEQLKTAYGRSAMFEVVTTDAGVLNREHCQWLDEQGYGYVMALRGNNPELELEARSVLQDLAAHEPPVASDEGFEADGARGWVKRELWTSTLLAGYPGWPHLRQVWLVRVWGKRTKGGEVEHLEDRVYATNLPEGHKLRGRHILTLVRAHWRIENDLHGTLDMQLDEDGSGWVRRGYGLINLGPAAGKRLQPAGPRSRRSSPARAAHRLAPATRLAARRDPVLAHPASAARAALAARRGLTSAAPVSSSFPHNLASVPTAVG